MDRKLLKCVSRSFKSRVDGTLSLTIEFEPKDAVKAVEYFGEIGTVCALAAIDESIVNTNQPQQTEKTSRDRARILYLSSFFRTQEVWESVGSDEAFLECLKTESCAFEGRECQGDVVAAHVRRVSNGAGVGIKPKYSAIPLCHYHHDLQHRKGEGILGGKEFFDQKRIEYVHAWAWQHLKHSLGFTSWTQVPIDIVVDWAKRNNVIKYLPKEYYE